MNERVILVFIRYFVFFSVDFFGFGFRFKMNLYSTDNIIQMALVQKEIVRDDACFEY